MSTLRTAVLFSKEHEVYLVLPEEGTFAEEARKAGIEPFILSFVRLRRFQKLRQWPIYFWNLGIAWIRFYSWLRKTQIDLVHFSDLIDIPFAIPARLAGCFHPGPFAVHPESSYRENPLSMDNRSICQASSLCLPGNPSVHVPLRIEKCPAALQSRPRGRNSLSPPVEEPDICQGLRILAISKFLEVKGHANLIELANRLEQQKIAFHVTLIGGRQEGHEAYYQYCMELLNRYNLRNRFNFSKQSFSSGGRP